MMNRSLLQRQMFANGGAAVPNEYKGFSKLPEAVQQKMNPDLAQKYQEGGVAGLMSQPNMAAMTMGSPQMERPPMAAGAQVDPAIMMSALEGASEEVGDLEQAGDFKSMMDQFSGEEKSEEERRDDLAGIVGPEDAAQTPDSVLALVTPVVQISMLDQGIAPMAQEAMDTPVEGDMAGGIMSMTGAGNEPPVNFNQGGEVLRRGDEDPVKFFEVGGPVQYFQKAGAVKPQQFDFNYQQKVGETAEALLPTFQQFMPATDPETAKRQLQSDILFDIANTALAFSAPMEGERSGLSAAERLALATQKTQLLPKIQQRTAKSAADRKAQEAAIKSGALQAAFGLEKARLENVSALQKIATTSSYDLVKQSKAQTFKREMGVSAQKHDKFMQNNLYTLKTKLDEVNKKLQSKYDIKLEQEKGAIQEQLKQVQEKIDLNQIDINQENDLQKINTEYSRKSGLADINNIATMERKVAEINSNEKITDKNNATKELIATEKNNTDRIINANNIEQKDRRLSFDKVRESNLVADRQAKNQQAIAELDLDKVTEARQTLEGLRDFELKKAAGERDEQKIALIEKELNEVKIAETEIKRFTAENKDELARITESRKTLEGLRDFELKKAAGERDQQKIALIEKELNDVKIAETEIKRFTAENKVKDNAATLAFKNKELKKLVEYRTKANDLKAELNQITRSNNVVNQEYKKKELALKTHKAQLELFGSGATGKTLNLLSNATRYEAYRDGGTDNQFELAVQNYIAKTTSPTGETIEKELPPYLKEILVDRLEQGLRIPDIPLYKLGLTESRIQELRPISDEAGEEAINTVIDEGVDLTQGTGVMSTVNTGLRWIAGQISEIGVGDGDVLSQTSSARKMLNALANVTEGFLREAVSNDRLDKDTIAIVRRDILRPTGTMTDANAYAQLKQTQQTIKAKLDEKRMIVNSPRQYTESQVTKARQSITMMKNLINNYGIALRSYEKFGGFGKGSGGSEQLFKNIIKKRKTN